jgi:N-acetylmuramoyl-L-alanine amidase
MWALMPVLRALALVVLLLVATESRAAGLPTVQHEGRPYVRLEQLAASLGTRLDATASSIRAYLRIPGHVVALTRNWAHVTIDDAPLVLEAPVRVQAGVWMVPQSFVDRVLPRIGAARPRAPAPVVARPEALPGPLGGPSAPATVVSAQAAVAPPAALARGAARPATLEELRFRSYPSFTRLVLETSAPVVYRLDRTASRETRVRVPSLAGAPRVEAIHDGLIAEIRLERAGADAIVRVVFEGPTGETKIDSLVDPYRLVIDFRRPEEPVERERTVVTPLRTIVLDAGHGGHDSGAVGPTGLMEKELVLDVTRRVARLAEEKLGVKVVLSRDSDHFVTLRDRTSFANRERADLFVSIHANAHREVANEGVETFFLSSEATDSGARQVAAQENSVVQLEAPANGRPRNDVLKAILWDLAQSEFQIESSRLAEVVQDSMTRSLRIPNRGVKQAGFYVLGGAAMPAVLIEIGFVTNPREERKLRDSRYRDEIARAIYSGLAEYKRNWDQRMGATAARPSR